jgi:hypothetical protein
MAQDNNTLARSLHDLGLATWFGGSLMGAVGLNGAAAAVDAPEQRLRVANTGWALGERLMQAGDAPVEGGTIPSDATPNDLAGVQRQLTVLQWVIPGLTGAALVLNALMGEQQRPQQVTSGLLQDPSGSRAPSAQGQVQ